MTPKEKAIELVDNYNKDITLYWDLSYNQAKTCALIAVEQIKEAIFWHPYESPNFELEYWNEVKQEIEAL
jgi:hypothetical protein